MLRRIISILISLMMVVTSMTAMEPFVMAEAGSEDASAGSEEYDDVTAFEVLGKDDYVHGEAVVLFEKDAVKDREMSVRSARKLDEVADTFGDAMDATGDAGDAADDAKSEIDIIKESLGDDFVIKDSVAFDDDLTMCLVSSDRYDTKTLIEKLSANGKIKSAEANTYLEPKSIDYSLNDALNQYAYHTNSPAENNKAGKNVSKRGTYPENDEDTASTRAGAVTDFAADHSSEDEVVVAVVDSGINYDHEDLQGVLWTNPGNIGLEGEHGFNFDDNATELKDSHGHGSHCSGIIAAVANNGKGVAGVASGINVKIMMCATSGSILDEDGEPIDDGVSTAFRTLGALSYVYRAKQRGVNVVATSNSWGSPDLSRIYDEVIDRLGEEGVISFIAASNDALDIDKIHYAPPGGDSSYLVSVGAVDVTGKPAGFSDYGKVNVDLFAPGVSILSTSAHSIYSPSLYTDSERAENTEYYGRFTSETAAGGFDEELGTNRVVADNGSTGDSPKAFGAVKFFKQEAGSGSDYGPEPDDYDYDGEDTDPEYGGDGTDTAESTCELSITEDRSFTDNLEPGSAARPASLKATIRNARVSEEYYLYFPFAKNPKTTGIDNTRYSITAIMQHEKDEFCAMVKGGEVVKYNKNGRTYCTCNTAGEIESSSMYTGEIVQFYCGGDGGGDDSLLSWEESDPETTDVMETGIGLCIRPSEMSDAQIEGDKKSKDDICDVTVYIDSLGVSKPTEGDTKPEDVFSPDTSYELMSGTSQATPAAAGAYAVLASLYPKNDGQTGAEYAQENLARLFSIVRQTDQLKDLCSTGGYVDLSLVKDIAEQSSITDAVCNVKAGTLTLHGMNLKNGDRLYCRSLADRETPEKALPSGNMKVSFSKDGKKITISNAKGLFGRYLEFILKKGNDVRARGSFYTVKGQTKLKKVLTEEHKNTFDGESDLPPRYILTDTNGSAVYAYQTSADFRFSKTAGVLYKYDGKKFVQYPGTAIKDAVFDYYEKELGYDRHQITRGLKSETKVVKQPIRIGNVIYEFVDAEYTPYYDADDENIERKTLLGALNFTAKAPKWTFTEIGSMEDALSDLELFNPNEFAYSAMNGKIYCFGTTVGETDEITDENNYTFVYSLDVKTGQWKREADLKGAALRVANAYYNNGKIWLLFGMQKETPSFDVYSFDGKEWKKHPEIPFVGRNASKFSAADGAAAPVKDGFVIFEYSVEGAGNVFLYNTTTGKCKPLYYTLGTALSDPPYVNGSHSAVETKDGLYYVQLMNDIGQISRIDMYRIPKTSYAYTPRYKSANTAKVTKKNLTVRAKALRKKAVKKTAVTVKKAKGAVSYKRTKVTCKKKLLKAARKKIKVNTKTGKITIGKGLKKGKYTISVTVKVKGDLIYKALTKTVKVKITVK